VQKPTNAKLFELGNIYTRLFANNELHVWKMSHKLSKKLWFHGRKCKLVNIVYTSFSTKCCLYRDRILFISLLLSQKQLENKAVFFLWHRVSQKHASRSYIRCRRKRMSHRMRRDGRIFVSWLVPYFWTMKGNRGPTSVGGAAMISQGIFVRLRSSVFPQRATTMTMESWSWSNLLWLGNIRLMYQA
jgi:hypothetical protein